MGLNLTLRSATSIFANTKSELPCDFPFIHIMVFLTVFDKTPQYSGALNLLDISRLLQSYIDPNQGRCACFTI
jgi:hypothetical protein